MHGPTIKIGNRVARFPRKGVKPAPLVAEDTDAGYAGMKRSELIKLAKKLKLKVRAGMSKAAVINLLRGE